METHIVNGPSDLENIGFVQCEYSEEMFYGPLHDRERRSGAYIDPLTQKIKVVRIMTGLKTLYNKSFSQFVSTHRVIWNLPDWQQGQKDGMKLEIGDYVEIYVSTGKDIKNMKNFYAGTFRVNGISPGRPTKVTFLPLNTDNQGVDTP
tara:strand:+ start:292 stop:735 length:444 start_codon:yes stop_codon:yes gene_type:complete